MNPQPITIQDIDGFWHTDFYYQDPISSEIKHHIVTTYLRATKGYKKKALRKAKTIQENVLKSLQAKQKNLFQEESSELNSRCIESLNVINLETKMTLIKKQKGYWYMDFTYTHKPTSKKKRCRKSTKFSATKQNKIQAMKMALELQDVLSHCEYEIENNPKQDREPEDLFSKVAHDYMETLKAKGLKTSTLRSYDSILCNHLLPKFSCIPVSQITTKIVDMWFSTLKGVRDQLLSKKTRNNIINFLSEIFGKAVVWGYCKENPIKHISRSKPEEKDMLFWSKDERDTFLETIAQKEPRFLPIFATFLFTGMRVGEILALKWEHIDFSNKTIHVQRNWVKGEETTPKSGKSRFIQICDFLVDILLEHQKKCQNKKGLVFSKDDGGYLSNDLLRRPFLHLCKEAGVKRIRMHDMRHTFASLALMDGVDVPTVQKWLGHKDIQTTMRYIKLLPKHMQEQSKKLNPNLSILQLYQTLVES